VTTGEHLRTLALAARLALRPRRPRPSAPPGSVLILGYAAIGDFLFFLPVIEELKRRLPEARITFLANDSAVAKEIIPAIGLVDDVWIFDWEGPRAAAERRSINEKIAQAGFDAALLTLSSPAHYFQEGLSRIPLRVGHLRPLEPGGPFNARLRLRRALVTGEFSRRALLNGVARIGGPSEYAVERNLRLLPAFGVPVPSPAPKPSLPISLELKTWAKESLAALGPKKIAVHLGPPRNQYHKIWDHERFGLLCARLAEAFRAKFVLVGGAEESESLALARRRHPLPHSWIGRCSALETFALISECGLFLGNDTGLAKAAMALGVPTATIWGPSDIREVGAPWDLDKHLDVRTGIACSPCARLGMAKEGGLNYFNCGHHDCLGKLDVDFAFRALAGKYGAFLDR
jgi:ADP-heptose:LPS heptosyltransferase